MKLEILKPIKSDTGFTIIPVHYTMDPDKTSVDWLLREQAKYKRENADWLRVWNKEMELDFTAVSGSPAYPHFTDLNVKPDLAYSQHIPLRLCCDFNVEPMVWEVAQVVRIMNDDIPIFIHEISMAPGSIDDMVTAFRNVFPDHLAEVWIYGDATGAGRSSQTAKSCYDLIRLAFRGYASGIRFMVPARNPDQRDRLNAFNLRLKDPEGRPGCFVSDKCPELIKDLREVVTKEDGTKIVKVAKRDNPYFWRTHASDAAGYFIYREWPTRREVSRRLSRPRPKRRVYQSLLGEM